MNQLSQSLEPDRRWYRNPDLIASSLLVLLGVLFFADVLFTSKNFYFRDILNFHYPLRKVLIDSYARGEWPLWNPYVYLGQPMLANPNYMAFYPTNLFHLFLPFNYAFKLHFVIHPILAGLGAYFLQRRLGLDSVPALAGAVAYQFSGTVLSFLNLYNLIPAIALIPWIGWAFWGTCQGRRLRRTLLLGLLLALQIIAFEPLLFQCCAFLMVTLAVVHLLDQQGRKRAIIRLLSTVLGAALFASGLAAVQILPTLELLPRSARGGGLDYSVASGWSMHPVDLINIVVPNLFGYLFSIGSATSWGESYHELTSSYLVSFFLGSVTVLLALLSFFSSRRVLQRTLFVSAVLSVALALGKFGLLYPFVFHYLPLFDLGRYPSKYFLLTALLVSVLASLGLEAVITGSAAIQANRNIRRTLGIAVGMALLILGLGLLWLQRPEILERVIRKATPLALAHPKDFGMIASQLARSVVSTGAFLLLGAVILMAGKRFRHASSLGLLVAVLIGIEVIPANLGLSPLISDADLDYVPELTSYVRQFGPDEPFRTVTSNYLSPAPTEMDLRAPNRSLAWLVIFYRRSGQTFDGIRKGLQYAIDRSVDHLNTRESDALWRKTIDLPLKRKLTLLANLNCPMIPSIGALDACCVDQLLSLDTHSNLDYRLYRERRVLPRAYFATDVIAAVSRHDALRRLLEADSMLSNTVILESTGDLAPQSGPFAPSQVTISRYSSNKVVCRVIASSAGYLVLLDSWYPGWRAYLDDREVPILRADYAFRAVAVPAGAHIVEFAFEPRSFHAGVALTCGAVLFGGLLVFLTPRKPRLAGRDL